ncbi:MAG: HAD-IB family hydrolase [Pseudomonadales bacterium]|nr:HAD-IB family hydrolase [Pseudomonadales bacterium]NRA18813.1 HAD family hydrolase [Oceanospirillaceae bacterium]
MPLRIFDLDETLVRCDSSSLFCEYLVERNLVEDAAYLTKERQLMELYSNQKLQIDDYIKFQIAPLAMLKKAEIEQLAVEFVAAKMRQWIYPEARELLRELSLQGHRIVIISATVAFIVRAIAKELGVEDVIGIDLQEVNGQYTGAIKGVPSYREGKVTRLQQWLQEHRQSLTQAHFYSDSINDLPLLELVDTPVVTNPDTGLAKIANERNWQLLNWQLVPSSV